MKRVFSATKYDSVSVVKDDLNNILKRLERMKAAKDTYGNNTIKSIGIAYSSVERAIDYLNDVS